jgi:hypothetical protein
VRVTLLSLAFLSLLAEGRALGADARIVVLHQPGLDAEEELLTESLRIYTRDLGCDVQAGGAAPAALDAPALEALQSAARADGLDYVLWVGARAGRAATYYALDIVPGELRQTEIGSAGASTAAQEAALKIRAVVSSRRRRSSSASSSAEVASAPANATAAASAPTDAGPDRPPPEGAPAVTPPKAPEAPPPAAASPAASLVARPAPAPIEGPRRPPRFTLDAGIGVTTPADRTWARSGLVLDLSGRVASPRKNLGVWIYAEGALSTHPSATVRGFAVTLSDLPVTAGASLRLRLSHGSLALGSRSTLHIFEVSAAAPDGRAAGSRRYGLGLGGLARAEATIGWHLGTFLEASVEGVVPTQEFTIGGQPAASTGAMLYGAVAGLSFTAP